MLNPRAMTLPTLPSLLIIQKSVLVWLVGKPVNRVRVEGGGGFYSGYGTSGSDSEGEQSKAKAMREKEREKQKRLMLNPDGKENPKININGQFYG